MSGVSVRLLQQRLRFDVVDDFDDNQPLRADHVSAFVPENLPEEIYRAAAFPCVVHLLSNHGKIEDFDS